MGDMNIDLIFKLRHTYDGRTDKYHCSFFAIILGKTQKMFPIEGKYYSIYNFVSCKVVNDTWLDCASYIARCFVFVFENKGVVGDKKVVVWTKITHCRFWEDKKCVDLTENEISSLLRLYGREGGNSQHKSAQNNIMNIMKATQYFCHSPFYFNQKKTKLEMRVLKKYFGEGP